MRPNTHRDSRNSERGYNLVEVLVAVAILGSVMLSVITLFFLGTANIYSGKQMTRAVAVGTLVSEDLSALAQDDVLGAFGITSATTMGTVDVDSTKTLPDDSYTGSILRKSNSITSGQDVRGLLARWQAEIDTERILQDGYVALVMTPRNPSPLAATLNPANATVMRIRILVRWVERGKNRQMIFDTLKTHRP